MVAVEIGALPWLSPSPSGLPPSPPPKNENITQRRPCWRQPAKDSALMVANGLPLARSGAACANAPSADGPPAVDTQAAPGQPLQHVEERHSVEGCGPEVGRLEIHGAEIQAGGAGMLPAGLILTGGGAQLAGIAELGRAGTIVIPGWRDPAERPARTPCGPGEARTSIR